MIFKRTDRQKKSRIQETSTDQLMNRIRESPQRFASGLLKDMKELRFEDYLKSLMEKYQCSPKQLIIRSCLSKPFVYQIMKGERIPGRDVILRMGFALKADVEEMQHLLMLAEKGILYPKVKRDAAILCCIESGKSLEDTNQFLEECGEKKLL